MMFHWNPFQPKSCAVCAEKERRMSDLDAQILLLKGQLAHSREREEKAIDSLLEDKGKASVTPSPRMTAKDSESAMRDVMGIFLDAEDDGTGTIVREVDQLSNSQSPLL